jgi:hypothetical protein
MLLIEMWSCLLADCARIGERIAAFRVAGG